jgi:two-component system, cell cycle sensor histidine kinase and response regulator CckA
VRESVVLVVDDETAVEDMINTLLVKHGFRTVSFGDPAQALNFFNEHKDIIDLVVTDFNMPEIEGGELARRMAAVNPEIPVVLITGYMGSLRASDCTPNVKIVLEKPTPTNLLLQTVRTLVDR